MHDVFERVDVGAGQKEDVFVRLGDDGWESGGASIGDEDCYSLADLVTGRESYLALRDWRLEGWKNDFGRGRIPVEVERESVGVDACS